MVLHHAQSIQGCIVTSRATRVVLFPLAPTARKEIAPHVTTLMQHVNVEPHHVLQGQDCIVTSRATRAVLFHHVFTLTALRKTARRANVEPHHALHVQAYIVTLHQVCADRHALTLMVLHQTTQRVFVVPRHALQIQAYIVQTQSGAQRTPAILWQCAVTPVVLKQTMPGVNVVLQHVQVQACAVACQQTLACNRRRWQVYAQKVSTLLWRKVVRVKVPVVIVTLVSTAVIVLPLARRH